MSTQDAHVPAEHLFRKDWSTETMSVGHYLGKNVLWLAARDFRGFRFAAMQSDLCGIEQQLR